MNHRMYHQIIAIIIVASVSFVSLCSSLTMAESAQSKPIKLKVLLLPFLSFAPFFIAEEEGYFAEQGLEIEYIKMDGSAAALPGLIQGDLDVVAGNVSIALLNAIVRGGIIKIVADKGRIASSADCTANAFLTRQALVETKALENPSQLRGRRIAMDVASPDGYFMEKLLQKAELTFDDVKTEDLPSPILSEALKAGTVDIVHATEPWITRLLRTGDAALWVAAKDVMPDFQFAVIIYGPNLLEKHPDAGQRFMAAYLKAVRQYNQGKTVRNMEILSQYTRLSQEFLQDACWSVIHSDGHINVQSVLDFQTWGLEKGLLDNVIPKNQFWDPSFIEYIN